MHQGLDPHESDSHLEDIRVVNCLPHDIYLATPAGLVPLERADTPELLYRPADDATLTIQVPGDSRLKVNLDANKGMIVFGSSNVPPVTANTIYLVSLFVMEQFPDRSDFVIANTWPVPDANNEDPRKAAHVLVGVTRAPFTVMGYRGLDDLPDFMDEDSTS